MSAFAVSFAVIFLAELGDKSQLVALWFSTRYAWWLVILGVTIATLVVHLGSTAIGATTADLLPEAVLLTIVGLSFFAFALWSLRGDKIDEEQRIERSVPFGALGVVTTGFFLSELGDKTQLATISIAGNESDFVGVWIGSTAGMVAADALAIAVGVFAGKRIPERLTATVAAVIFAAFGTLALIRAADLAF
jgi:putative Ca2+/H+ antiporter (TMEM165/GDT1 family)